MNRQLPPAGLALQSAVPQRQPHAEFQGSGALPFILGSALLGTIGVFVHEANASPITATWFRCAFGLLGITAWLAIRKEASALKLTRSTGPWILSAALLMVLAWALFFAAIERTSAGIASVLFHVQPLWVLVLSVWFLKRRPSRHRVFAVTLAMVGLVLATGLLDELTPSTHTAGENFSSRYSVGILLCLFGALCTGCVTLIAGRAGAVPAGVLAWWQCAIGTLTLVAWPTTQGWPAWGSSWAWLAGLGLIHTGLAYSLIYAGIARLSADRVAVFQFIYPALVILFDWMFYGERLGLLQIMGAALMALAIFYSERRP
jgi:drug/metabolite transporter (DMT)-like permease